MLELYRYYVDAPKFTYHGQWYSGSDIRMLVKIIKCWGNGSALLLSFLCLRYTKIQHSVVHSIQHLHDISYTIILHDIICIMAFAGLHDCIHHAICIAWHQQCICIIAFRRSIICIKPIQSAINFFLLCAFKSSLSLCLYACFQLFITK